MQETNEIRNNRKDPDFSNRHTEVDDRAILHAVRRLGRRKRSSGRTAFVAIALAGLVVGASARDVATYFWSPDPLPYYLTDEYRHRCGLLLNPDGTIAAEEARPPGY